MKPHTHTHQHMDTDVRTCMYYAYVLCLQVAVRDSVLLYENTISVNAYFCWHCNNKANTILCFFVVVAVALLCAPLCKWTTIQVRIQSRELTTFEHWLQTTTKFLTISRKTPLQIEGIAACNPQFQMFSLTLFLHFARFMHLFAIHHHYQVESNKKKYGRKIMRRFLLLSAAHFCVAPSLAHTNTAAGTTGWFGLPRWRWLEVKLFDFCTFHR